MNFEQSKGLFLEEARELLARAETSLLKLEENPNDQDPVNEVFRALHTIKGSGAMFGFQEVADFTHNVENLFDEIRKGRLEINSDVVEIGLQAVDHIGRLLVNQADSQVAQLIQEGIEDLYGPVAEKKETPTTTAPSIPRGEWQQYEISFQPEPALLERGVRVEALLAELVTLGEARVKANINRVPPLEVLNPFELFVEWNIILKTEKSLAEIRQVFIFVEDYAKVEITPSNPTLTVSSTEKKQVSPLAMKEAVKKNSELEAKPESSIRVRKDKLDTLVDTVGELVILQARLDQEARRKMEPALVGISETLSRLTADLRDTTMSIRMVPLEELFAGFHRLIRDLSRSLGKDLVLEVSGASTEIDKSIIDSLKDPLLHIIRNAADHGIESKEQRLKVGKNPHGTIRLSAGQRGSRVEITVSDDGAGLNLEKIKAKAVAQNLLMASEMNEERIRAMIFEPGFSTAEVTTELSGRGVGMDVVKRNIERLRGDVAVSSVPHQGTTFTISIPLTLVIIDGLLVRIETVDYIIPLGSVIECVDMTAEFQQHYAHQGIINLRGQTIPVVDLRIVFGHQGSYSGISRLVIANHMGINVGLRVDTVLSKQQVVIKPIASARSVKMVSGATILGDGSVALILDLSEIIKKNIKNENKEVRP